MNDIENAELIFESLVDIVIQRKELGEVEALLRKQLQALVETMPLSAEYRGYITYLAKNTPSRRMDYTKLEKLYEEQYQWLIDNKIIQITQPKTLHRLVVTPQERKRL